MFDWLSHPQTRGLDLDDPHTTQVRREIVRSNGFIFKIYQEWYVMLARSLPNIDGAVLELGSGPGFLDEIIPGLVTSEIIFNPWVNAILNGERLPLARHSLRAIVMTDVLHHIPHPRWFFSEATRCIKPGGVIAMIEPWNTAWSRLIYTRFHHEPFRPEATEWEFPSSGPLSGANGANPWIFFQRDRNVFETEFPEWQIESIYPMIPIRYLLSGGVSRRNLVPVWSYSLWRWLGDVLDFYSRNMGMFAHIVLRSNRKSG